MYTWWQILTLHGFTEKALRERLEKDHTIRPGQPIPERHLNQLFHDRFGTVVFLFYATLILAGTFAMLWSSGIFEALRNLDWWVYVGLFVGLLVWLSCTPKTKRPDTQ